MMQQTKIKKWEKGLSGSFFCLVLQSACFLKQFFLKLLDDNSLASSRLCVGATADQLPFLTILVKNP